MDRGHLRKRFDRWTLVHSAMFLVLSSAAAALSPGSPNGRQGLTPAAAAFALAAFAPFSFAALFAVEGKSSLYLPNFVSLARLAGAELALLGAAGFFPRGWTLFALLAASALSDLADGLLARRTGTTQFGGKLDMELDACFTCALSIGGRLIFGAGAWVVAMGLMRYAYVFLLLFLPPMTVTPLWYARTAKGACAYAVFSLLLVAAPVFPGGAVAPLAASALGVLGVSFALDAAIRLLCGGNERGAGPPRCER